MYSIPHQEQIFASLYVDFPSNHHYYIPMPFVAKVNLAFLLRLYLSATHIKHRPVLDTQIRIL